MKNFSSKMFYILIGSLLSFLMSYYFYSVKIAIKEIDVYTIIDDDYVSKPTFPNSKIELKVDGVAKNKLGLVGILLINYTTEDFIGLPIIIKVTPQKGDNFTLIDYSAKGKGRVNELVTEVKKKYFDGDSYIFSYITNLNREEKQKEGMRLSILYEGLEPIVEVIPTGVGVREYDPNNSPDEKSKNIMLIFKLIGFLILMGVIFTAFVAFFLSPLSHFLSQEKDKKIRHSNAKEHINIIKSNNLLPEKSDEEISNLVAKLLYTKQLNIWEKELFMTKLMAGFIVPKESDYLVEIEKKD